MDKKTYFKSQLVTCDYTPDAQSLEEKIATLLASGAPIESVSPLIYTERKDGVKPEFDIRTDRFELAIDAGDKIAASFAARREGGAAENPQPNNE